MSTDTVFRRRISPTERMYLWARELAPPFLMQIVIHGSGDLDPGAVQRAVDIASAANPGSRLIRDGRYWVDSGRAAAVRVVPGATVKYPLLEEDPVLTSPIGPTPDRTCEVLLLTGAPVTLVVRTFHGVMDGMGTVMWVLDIFRALRGEEPIGATDPIADAELVSRIGAPGKPTPILPIYPAATGHGRQLPGMKRHLLRQRTIDFAGKSPLARVAAILAETAGATSRFMIPVDLRRHDPQLRSTANLALPLFVDVAPGEDWRTINARIRTGLAEKRELNQMNNGGLLAFPDGVAHAIMHAGNWIGARLGRNMVSATVSNMGRFRLDDLSVPGWRATDIRMLPQHSGMMPLLFGVAEYDGRTHITVSARNGVGVEERLEALLDRIAATLEREFAPAAAD
ncbi:MULTISPECIES: peptide synthetase [unclassified Nocardia]|uniref:peptide synthetase n=1 Tax=unclassified Nocardia TaxID=2637762 RepID=UPI001CE4221B|nr:MULTISPECIES: peptide synthetase [unclassified Nocardia]